MGLSTKVSDGGGLPKTIQKGKQTFKINAIRLEQAPWMEKDNAYSLIMECESEPIDGFEGFYIDPNNPNLGRYAGQVGKIKTNRWPYKDGTTKGGTEVFRDNDIMIAINRICKAIGSDWLKQADGKYNTIEELVEGFNSDAPFRDKFVTAVIACREYAKQNSAYPGQELFLPRGEKGKVTMEAKDANPSVLIEYDPANHYTPVEQPAGGGDKTDSFGADDAEVAPEFDI